MNKTNKIWTAVIVVILVIIAVYFFVYRKQKQPVVLPVVDTNSNVVITPINVTYYCKEGVLKAVYKSSSIDLSLKDGSLITLPQVISGSGIRYELGTTAFVSKGDNANLTENNVQTYTSCVAGIMTTNKNTNTYTNASKIFSFSYPNQFTLSGGDIGYSQDWTAQSSDLGLLLALVYVPKSFLPKTNFGEAKFTVGTSVDPDAITNCLKQTNGNTATTTQVTIGSRKFTKITFTDVGAGNFYATTSYRTIYNDQCYAIEYTVHSSNIDNYSPDQGIKAFDKAKIDSILEGIVKSFKFL